jgi:hypothetical protein
MSLTSMLKGKGEIDIELQTILRNMIPSKKQFSTISGNEAFSTKECIKAPYNLSNPHHSSIVGTAFDFMARFIVAQKIINGKNNATYDLNAKNGLELIKRFCDKKTIKSLDNKFDKSINLASEFVKNSKMNIEDLLPYVTYLAKLEIIYRSGMPPQDIKGSLLGKDEKEIHEDLKRLCVVFIEHFMIPEIIKPKSIVVFNPHFGIGSIICGGADADIFIDGTLYDFKTSKNPGYRWIEISQIFGYYFLNKIAANLKDDNAMLNGFTINRLAIYKARYGTIEFIDISTMDAEKMEVTFNEIYDLLKPPSKSETSPVRRGKKDTNIFKKLLSLLGVKNLN